MIQNPTVGTKILPDADIPIGPAKEKNARDCPPDSPPV